MMKDIKRKQLKAKMKEKLNTEKTDNERQEPHSSNKERSDHLMKHRLWLKLKRDQFMKKEEKERIAIAKQLALEKDILDQKHLVDIVDEMKRFDALEVEQDLKIMRLEYLEALLGILSKRHFKLVEDAKDDMDMSIGI